MFIEFVNEDYVSNRRVFPVIEFYKAGQETTVSVDIDRDEARYFLKETTPQSIVLPVPYDDFKKAVSAGSLRLPSYNVITKTLTFS